MSFSLSWKRLPTFSIMIGMAFANCAPASNRLSPPPHRPVRKVPRRVRDRPAGGMLSLDAQAGEDVDSFLEYLPDRRPVAGRKAFFLLSQVAKVYAGPEFDLDVQLVLKAAEVPACKLAADETTGPRLGWNCWLLSGAAKQDAEEAVFEGQPLTVLGERPA